MSNTLTPSESVAPVAPVEAVPDVEQVFTHTHNDGKEFSGTAEDARKVCDFLGKMSLESVQSLLAQDDLVARVAERGRTKRVTESAKPLEKAEETAELDTHKNEPQLRSLELPEFEVPVVAKEADELVLHAGQEHLDSVHFPEVSVESGTSPEQIEIPGEPSVKLKEHTVSALAKGPAREQLIPSSQSSEALTVVEPKPVVKIEVQPVTVQVETPPPMETKTAEVISTEELVESTESSDSQPVEPVVIDDPIESKPEMKPVEEVIETELPLTIQEAEVDSETPPKRIIIESITNELETEPEIAEKVVTLVEVLPERVQETLVEYIKHAEPEIIEPVQEIIIELAVVADRLHEMAMTDQLDTVEAEQAQELLVELYVELLSSLEMEIDEEVIKAFVEQICTDDYKAETKVIHETFRDILHERQKPQRFNIPTSLTYLSPTALTEVARLMVRRSLVAG
jgi:hypothetical protein